MRERMLRDLPEKVRAPGSPVPEGRPEAMHVPRPAPLKLALNPQFQKFSQDFLRIPRAFANVVENVVRLKTSAASN
jgi:hypothetical protein